MHARTYACTHIRMYAHIRMHAHVYIVYACTHIRMYAHTHVRTSAYAHMCVRMYCLSVSVCSVIRPVGRRGWKGSPGPQIGFVPGVPTAAVFADLPKQYLHWVLYFIYIYIYMWNTETIFAPLASMFVRSAFLRWPGRSPGPLNIQRLARGGDAHTRIHKLECNHTHAA